MSDRLLDRVTVAIGSQYLIEGEVGRGGSGVVYRATDAKLGRRVAIKVLPPELAFSNESVRTRFIREAQTAAQLNHPNIVPIYSVDERDGIVFFAMSLVEGLSVGALLKQDGRWPIDRAERVLREVADALAYAHSRGVVHRDVKPDNILIDRNSGRAMVTDFGIARASAGETRLTQTGVAVGTPAYMSPEQATGDREVDGRSDLYSLGVVGYHMLVGEQPFQATSAAAMLVKHVSETPPRVARKRPEVPAYLGVAIDRALAKRPDDRWANASEFRDALAGAQVLPPQGYPVVGGSRMPAPHRLIDAPPPPSAVPVDAGWAQQQPTPFEAFWQPTPPPPGLSIRELRRWHKNQSKQRRAAIKEYERHQFRTQLASVQSGVHRRARRNYDDRPLVDRVLSFRGAVFRFAFLTPAFMIWNAATGDGPWFFIPAGLLLFDALRRGGSVWSDGIGPFDAFRKGIRKQLLEEEAKREAERAPDMPARSGARGGALPPLPPGARVDHRAPPSMDRALATVAPEVLAGAHGPAVRRAVEDSAVVRDALARLGPLERDMLPDVGPTVTALTDRVANLAATLQRLDTDVSGATLGALDQRISALKTDPTSSDQERRLALLERQRTSLTDLLSRRQSLQMQLESAGLALQNLKLDLLKLRSAGVTAAIDGGSSATQEARSVSRDIGRIIEVADDLRNI